MGTGFLRGNQFNLHENYIYYLEYFQKGNRLFGGVIPCFMVEYLNYDCYA